MNSSQRIMLDKAATSAAIEKALSKLSFNTNPRRTLTMSRIPFNTTDLNLTNIKSSELDSYEEYLNQEIKCWETTIRKTKTNAAAAKAQCTPALDVSVLSPENAAYLKSMPNLQNFIRDSLEFCEEATIFMSLNLKEIRTIENNLLETWERKISLDRLNQIDEHKSNKSVLSAATSIEKYHGRSI